MKYEHKVSVVITYYNKGRFLYNALGSLNKQTINNFETILVNDCSNDRESQMVWREISNSNFYQNKLVLYDLDKNYGASFAKNVGVRNASGDIIALLDADDVMPPTAIENIYEAFQKHRDASVIFGNYSHNNQTVDCSILWKHNKIDIPTLLDNWILLGTSPFKKKAFEEIGGFNILYPNIDDTDFHMRLLMGKYVFKYINQNIYTWIEHRNSNSKTVKREDSAKLFFRNIDIYIHNYPIRKLFMRLLKNFLIIIISIFYKQKKL